MEYRQFKYILAIAEEKSISLAAKKLYISQPSLSQLLQKVEEKIGGQLFDRSIVPLKPTYIGELYLETAKKTIDLNDQFRQKVDDVLKLRTGKLVIGVSPFRSTCLLSGFIPVFRELYPNIDLILRESTTLALEDLAQSGQTDVSISLFPVNSQNFSYRELFTEEVLIALPENHPICKKYNLIPGNLENLPAAELSQFADTPFILMHREQKLHDQLFSLCKEAGFKPRILLETQSMNAAHALAGTGLGVALLPDTLIRSDCPQKAPCYIRLTSCPTRTAVVIWRKDRYLSHAAQKFIDVLEDFCQSINPNPR